MLHTWRIFYESLLIALQELKVNRTRTVLTLMGISIGIFCIISVFSVVDSMKKSIHTSIESLGSNVLYIQKWPWEFSSDFAWWKYMKRPVPTLQEQKEIEIRSKTADFVVYSASTNTPVERDEIKVDQGVVLGTTKHYPDVTPFEIAEGRFFTENEFNSGINVAIIGFAIATELFPAQSPLEKKIKVFGQKVTVIGLIAEEGQGSFASNHDWAVLVPVNFYRRFIDVNDDRNGNSMIIVKVKQNISNEQAKDELTGILRSVRRLKPTAEDNFSINEASLISKGFESLFSILTLAGWIIGSFSLLVGGFGIANIMFVSVSERTRIIGVQKAIGAKSHFVLFQYLVESVFLSIMGGIIGLIVVALLALLVSQSAGFELFVSSGNVMTALSISAVIGIVSGLAPAYKASRLDPVEAIRR